MAEIAETDENHVSRSTRRKRFSHKMAAESVTEEDVERAMRAYVETDSNDMRDMMRSALASYASAIRNPLTNTEETSPPIQEQTKP